MDRGPFISYASKETMAFTSLPKEILVQKRSGSPIFKEKRTWIADKEGASRAGDCMGTGGAGGVLGPCWGHFWPASVCPQQWGSSAPQQCPGALDKLPCSSWPHAVRV